MGNHDSYSDWKVFLPSRTFRSAARGHGPPWSSESPSVGRPSVTHG